MQSYMYEQLGWFQYAVFPRQIMLQQTTVCMWFFSYTVWGLYSKSVIESMIAELNNACIYSFVEHCQILPYCAILHTTSNVLKCLLTALQTQYVNTVCFDFSSMTGKKDVNVVLICIYSILWHWESFYIFVGHVCIFFLWTVCIGRGLKI